MIRTKSTVGRLALAAVVAAGLVPAVAMASTPPSSTTMAEAVIATRSEATRLMDVFAGSDLQATAAEMHIAACEDRARMHRPDVRVRLDDAFEAPVEPADIDAVVGLLVDDGWSSTETPRFDEGVDDSNADTGYTVSASRGEHRIIVRVLADEGRGWFDLLGACLDNTDHERDLYLEIGRWALPVPGSEDGATSTAPGSTLVP